VVWSRDGTVGLAHLDGVQTQRMFGGWCAPIEGRCRPRVEPEREPCHECGYELLIGFRVMLGVEV
jgi:hypothetical protein